MHARTRLIPIALFVLILAGCEGKPPQSRLVTATEAGPSPAPGDRDATTKVPRRIATH